MNQLINNRNLTIANFGIVSYFMLIWLLYIYNIEFVLIGVIRELFTIPLLIAQVLILVVGTKHIIQKPSNFLTIISVCLLAICAVLTIGSFF